MAASTTRDQEIATPRDQEIATHGIEIAPGLRVDEELAGAFARLLPQLSEDVVVDATVRGRGVGEALSQAALERAAAEGARSVGLTSRPSREAANRLYRRLGFALRETNLYRYAPRSGDRYAPRADA